MDIVARLWIIFFLITISICKNSVLAQVRLSPSIKEVYVADDIYLAWMDDLFQSEEFWPIRNSKRFFRFLKSKNVNNRTLNLLKKQFVKKLPDEVGHIASFHGDGFNLNDGGYILVPDDIKKRIPLREQNIIYQSLYDQNFGPPYWYGKTKKALISTIKSWNLTKTDENLLIKKVIKVNDYHQLPIVRDIWKKLPEDIRDNFIEIYTSSKRLSRQNVRTSFRIDNDQHIKNLAKKYQYNSNKEAIERFLKRKVRINKGFPIIIDLQEILPPFIRKNIYRYHLTGGPNCYNSGLCVNEGNHYKKEFTKSKDLKRRLNRDYRLLDPKEKMQLGDLLYYTEKSSPEKSVHVATYIDEKVTFTKNGINKFNPYIFQKQETVEKVYFSEGKEFILKRYRYVANNPCIQVFFKP